VIVIDASVLANAIGDDHDDGRVARTAIRDHDLAAPDLVDVETMAVLRKRWLAGDLSARRLRSAVDDLVDLALLRHPVLSLLHRAYELRANVTPYDATYVALAEHLDCPLLTADRRLAAAPGLRCEVRLLAA
jgi:predicted nucleic acid-binding protein